MCSLISGSKKNEEALTNLAAARQILQPTLTALWGESYSRAYKTLVAVQVSNWNVCTQLLPRVASSRYLCARLSPILGHTRQVLSEVEEVLRYPALPPNDQLRVRRTWLVRLQGAQKDPAVWQPLLKVDRTSCVAMASDINACRYPPGVV